MYLPSSRSPLSHVAFGAIVNGVTVESGAVIVKLKKAGARTFVLLTNVFLMVILPFDKVVVYRCCRKSVDIAVCSYSNIDVAHGAIACRSSRFLDHITAWQNDAGKVYTNRHLPECHGPKGKHCLRCKEMQYMSNPAFVAGVPSKLFV